jgi:hypothetical protein
MGRERPTVFCTRIRYQSIWGGRNPLYSAPGSGISQYGEGETHCILHQDQVSVNMGRERPTVFCTKIRGTPVVYGAPYRKV